MTTRKPLIAEIETFEAYSDASGVNSIVNVRCGYMSARFSVTLAGNIDDLTTYNLGSGLSSVATHKAAAIARAAVRTRILQDLGQAYIDNNAAMYAEES